MKRLSVFLFAFLMFFAARSQNAGDFDPSFGTNGITFTAVGNNYSFANAMAIQPDGKIIMVGKARFGSYRIALVRYNANGTLDDSFGENGIVTTVIGQNSEARSIVLQPDGRILVSGLILQGSSFHGIVMRLESNGSPDNSFGTTGVTHLSMENAESLALYPDGKMVAGGYEGDHFALAKLNANGSFDTSFGTNGKVITQIPDINGNVMSSYIQQITLQNDGKILAAGFHSSFSTNSDFCVVRYLSNGSLDNAFAQGGIFSKDLGGLSDFGTSIALQADGKILIGGHKELGILPGTPTYAAAILRLNTNGTLDNTFGQDGQAYFRMVEEANYVSAIALQADGKIVFTGRIVTNNTTTYDIYVARISSNGSFDTPFAGQGFKVIDPNNTDDNSSCILVQPDGKIVVGGESVNTNSYTNFRIMRFLGEAQQGGLPSVDVSFANVATTSLDVSLTPNDLCASYHFVIMTQADMQMWLPMMGSPEAIIQQWGIQKTSAYTHHYTDLSPDTEYYVYTLCVGNDGNAAPYDSTYVKTLSSGGQGTASATIQLLDITPTSVRMLVTPNPETAVFFDGLITKEYFDEIGEEAAVEIIRSNGFPMYGIDDWVWLNLESETIYKAIASCKNAAGEWGPTVIEEFTTLTTSINKVEKKAFVLSPSPNDGAFQLSGDDLNGAGLSIYNENGKKVFSKKMNENNIAVDIRNQANGLYIIEIEKGRSKSTMKFLKQ